MAFRFFFFFKDHLHQILFSSQKIAAQGLSGKRVWHHRVVVESDVFATLRAQDVVALGQEAATDEGDRALLAVEAVVVPLAFLKANVLTASKTTDGSSAGGTLLGVQVAEAVEAIGKVIPGGEALA